MTISADMYLLFLKLIKLELHKNHSIFCYLFSVILLSVLFSTIGPFFRRIH